LSDKSSLSDIVGQESGLVSVELLPLIFFCHKANSKFNV